LEENIQNKLGQFCLVCKMLVESHFAYSRFAADFFNGYPFQPMFPEQLPGSFKNPVELFVFLNHGIKLF
jgi:hypothetical protein